MRYRRLRYRYAMVLRPAWSLGEELLRPAQIVVATSPETARSWR